MARFHFYAIKIALCAMAVSAAPQRMPRRLLDNLPDLATVQGTNVQRTNRYSMYSNALGSVLQNEAQAQAAAGNPISVTSAVADTIKAGQVDSDTRRHVAGGDASAAISQAAGAPAGPVSAQVAAREASGLASYTVYGQGLQMSAINRAEHATLDSQRAVQLSIDSGNVPAATQGAMASVEAATLGTRSHDWTE